MAQRVHSTRGTAIFTNVGFEPIGSESHWRRRLPCNLSFLPLHTGHLKDQRSCFTVKKICPFTYSLRRYWWFFNPNPWYSGLVDIRSLLSEFCLVAKLESARVSTFFQSKVSFILKSRNRNYQLRENVSDFGNPSLHGFGPVSGVDSEMINTSLGINPKRFIFRSN